MNSENLKVAFKEFSRLLIFAIPGILIQVLTNNPELSVGWGGIALGFLKSWDRSIHEDTANDKNGLLPF